MRILFAVAANLACLMASLRADTVVFKNGQELEGVILEQTEEAIKLEARYGVIKIPCEKILRIAKDTPEIIKEREEKAVAERELIEKMRADGKVLYKGKWVAKEEKDAEEIKLAAAKKKKEQELADARKKAQEDKESAKKKKEEQRLADAQRRRQQQLLRDNSRGATNDNNAQTDFFGRKNFDGSLSTKDVLNRLRRQGYGNEIKDILRRQDN